MKNIVLIIGAICLLAHLLAGLIISIYAGFNIVLNGAVIVINTLLIYLTITMRQRDGYKIPLSGLFGSLGFVEYAICLFAPARLENNIPLLAVIIILLAEVAILTVTSYVSNHVK